MLFQNHVRGCPANTETDLEITAPRIKSDFKPQDEDLIQGQKRKQWRRERRLKRIITVALGFFAMAWMIYLIAVTSITAPKIWDPYSILQISRVSLKKSRNGFGVINRSTVIYGAGDQEEIQGPFTNIPSRQSPTRPCEE